jgi:ABC-type hemin transport system substrate-binding protein
MVRSNDGRRRWGRASAALVVTLAALVACGREPAAPPPAGDGPRIVSLSPAISRALVDLGLGDRVVGRTPFCAALDPALPVVGDLQHVDFERLVRLAPTHVLVQPASTGVDPRLAGLADRHGWSLQHWTLNDVADVIELVRTLPAALATRPGTTPTGLERRSAALAAELAASLRPPSPSPWRGRTLLVCGLDPLTVFGAETYLHELLVAQGARNATEARGWAMLSMEDVARLDPEAIVLVVDARLDAEADPDRRLGALRQLDVAAVRDGRMAVLDDPDAFLPSTGLPAVARRLESILRGFAGPAS